jgi:hypothetical protein
MAQSLFQRKPEGPSAPPTPHELIEREIGHLKKKKLARYGDNPRKMSLWLLVAVACALVWLYIQDPVEHAWYKGEAIKAYLYLHNYGAGKEADELAASGILQPEEITQLNQRHDSFQDYYPTPQAAARSALTIVSYMASVKELHAGRYENLDPLGRLRYALFVRFGIVPPTDWPFLDPGVNQ